MMKFTCSPVFLLRRNTVVFQGEKRRNVREVRILRHIGFEYLVAKLGEAQKVLCNGVPPVHCAAVGIFRPGKMLKENVVFAAEKRQPVGVVEPAFFGVKVIFEN